ncbi:MAG: phosphomethylpyrimidine synthase ThiC, partial [Thermoplasmata archaeon]|nr:phosphomethylpyrimidine synthase ThiC [Thermoplasmata archaeon]
DIKVATITSKIAAHVADISHGYGMERDIELSKARAALDWDRQFELCIDPEHARARRKESRPGKDDDVCTMCGKYCAIKLTNEYLKKK